MCSHFFFGFQSTVLAFEENLMQRQRAFSQQNDFFFGKIKKRQTMQQNKEKTKYN
eukprot:m.188376 g.188376  ORF g.188376 m.188376 type:complete len:55 (-) comp18183_c0_seq9:201-365(-)